MVRTNTISQPSWMMTLASVAVVIASLYLAKGVLVPLTLAALLSFLLSPVCDWLERWRLGRIPAVLMTAMLAQVFETQGCRVQPVSVTAMAGEMVGLVDQCAAADLGLHLRHAARRGHACTLSEQTSS